MEIEQESPADADKPTRRESMPKIVPVRRENELQTNNDLLEVMQQLSAPSGEW